VSVTEDLASDLAKHMVDKVESALMMTFPLVEGVKEKEAFAINVASLRLRHRRRSGCQLLLLPGGRRPAGGAAGGERDSV
jgi:hypothetical protein